MTNEHSYDGTRQSDSSASYYGTVFSCSCGQPFVHKQDLLEHIAEELTKQALKAGIADLRECLVDGSDCGSSSCPRKDLQ